MKSFTRARLAGLTVLALSVVPATSNATNGYFSHGYGTKAKGLAGAGVALPQDALAPATNPAGLVTLGNRIDAGAALFSPRRQYTVTGAPSLADGAFSITPDTIESDNEWFVIPHFGINRVLDANSAVGLAIYGNGGMNSEYRGGSATLDADPTPGSVFPVTLPGTFGADTIGVDLMQLFLTPTYARRINSDLSVGISPILAVQRFSSKGLANFAPFSNYPNELSNNGNEYSWGFGARIGVLYQVNDKLTLGAAYQSRIYMSELDNYRGMFAEQGDLDIPQNATIGIAYHPTSRSTVVLDIQRIWYDDSKAISDSIYSLTSGCALGDSSQCLGGDNGAGFGWRNMTIYKLGYQWDTDGGWTWRVGYSQGKQPVPSGEVLTNILSPGVMEKHITFGFTKQTRKGQEFNFAAMYAPDKSVTGSNPFDPSQTVKLEMHQFELEASWAWKF